MAIKTIKKWVPKQLKDSITTRLWKMINYLPKPFLWNLEMHLTDHCNLNCRSCSHFCPIAAEWFASPAVHDNDMRRMSQIFPYIYKIRLLGGEPLLHPELDRFMVLTRNYFPSSNISIGTNGLLLKKMKPRFWQCCRDNDIDLDVTIYPPVENRIEAIASLARAQHVNATLTVSKGFRVSTNLSGNSDPENAFNNCPKAVFLKEGKLYPCALASVARNCNDYFGATIPLNQYLDIYSDDLTPKKVNRFLSRPSAVCSFCTDFSAQPLFEWSVSNRLRKEWDASDPSHGALSSTSNS